jgi:hypothetical protein
VWDAESGKLHRELEGFGVTARTTFPSADGQQPRLVAKAGSGELRVYDPEAGSTLHRLDGHTDRIADLACIASSSAAPHHPRVVSASWDRTAKVWDGETGEMLAKLRGHESSVVSVAVWKEHTGGHDRTATANSDGHVRVWGGEAFVLLNDLDCGGGIARLVPFETAEGPARLMVSPQEAHRGLQVWDPEEGRLLHDGINRELPSEQLPPVRVGKGATPPGRGGHLSQPPSAPRRRWQAEVLPRRVGPGGGPGWDRARPAGQ